MKLEKKVENFIKRNLSPGAYKIYMNRVVYPRFNRRVARVDVDHLPLFGRIAIETVNRCNGHCTFCPVNVHQEQRPYAKMSWELFTKIIDNMAALDYSGSYAIMSNNEPFLDERIVEFYRYAKQKLPKAYADIWTNGTLLTMDRFLEILPWLDKIIVDNYNNDGKMNPNTKAIDEYCQQHPEVGKKVRISMRLEDEVLTSRGGQAPNKRDAAAISAKCAVMFNHFTVRPDGKVSLCNNDPLGAYTLGDLNRQTLEEVWYGDDYQTLRRTMQRQGRKAMKLCNHCDAFYRRIFYPSTVRSIENKSV